MIAKPKSNFVLAHGGPAITTRSRFYKSPEPFRDDDEITEYKKVGKGGSMSKLTDKTKSAKLPKRRTR